MWGNSILDYLRKIIKVLQAEGKWYVRKLDLHGEIKRPREGINGSKLKSFFLFLLYINITV